MLKWLWCKVDDVSAPESQSADAPPEGIVRQILENDQSNETWSMLLDSILVLLLQDIVGVLSGRCKWWGGSERLQSWHRNHGELCEDCIWQIWIQEYTFSIFFISFFHYPIDFKIEISTTMLFEFCSKQRPRRRRARVERSSRRCTASVFESRRLATFLSCND